MPRPRNLLYLTDPGCVHSRKWIRYFSAQAENYRCFLMGEISQVERLSSAQREQLRQDNIDLLRPVHNFSLAKFWRTARDAYQLDQAIRRHQIDLVHVMFAEPTCLWSWFKPLWRRPCVLTTRGTDILVTIPRLVSRPNWHGRLMKALFGGSFRKFDYLTGTSQRQLNQVQQLFGVDSSRLHLIRTGTQVADFEEDHSESLPMACQDKPYVFFPRYMKALYNHDFSLKALQLLPPQLAEGLRFVFVGSDGHDQEYIQSFAARLNSLPHLDCVFLPQLDRASLVATYQRAKLVVMNPLSDGTPVSGIEAMLAGAPLILGPLNYDPDLFNEQTCRKLSSWSSQELADLIVSELRPNPERLARAKSTARQLADSASEVRRLERLYQQLLP